MRGCQDERNARSDGHILAQEESLFIRPETSRAQGFSAGGYVPLLERFAAEQGIPLASILLDSREKAQNAPAPCTKNFSDTDKPSIHHHGRKLTWRQNLNLYNLLPTN